MGLFFERRKNSKPFILIKSLIMLVVLTVFGVAAFKGFPPVFLKILWVTFGCIWIVDGIEGFVKKEAKKRYLVDFGIAALFIILPFI